jgi:hypothetical protein
MSKFLRCVVAVLVLVVGACTSASDDEVNAGTEASVLGVDATSTDGEPSASTTASTDRSDDGPDATDTTVAAEAVVMRGVSDTEIQLGIGIIDASAFGFDGGDQQAQWQVAIDAVNDAGGIHGRTLVPTYESYSPVGATEPDAACLRLTEDVEVFAFVGFVRESNELCYTESHNTIAINRETPTDDAIDRSNGLLFTAGFTKLAETLRAVEAAAADGLIEGQRIHITSQPTDERLVGPVQEELEALGAEVTGDFTTTSDAGDIPALEQEYDVLVERLLADGVDTIFAAGSTGSGTVGAVERAGADIRVISVSTTAATFVRFGYDPSVVDLRNYAPPTLDAMHAAGINGVPECVDRYEAATGNTVNIGQVDPVPNNFINVVSACQAVELFAAVAEAAGPGLTNDTFIAAAEGLGSVTLTGTSAASLGPNKVGADDTPFVGQVWDADTLAFVAAS